MNSIFHIQLIEQAGQSIELAPIQFGCPLPKGLYYNHKVLSLITEDECVLAATISPTVLWPDNSIKWCLVKTEVTLDANQSLKLQIVEHPEKYDTSQCPTDLIFETKTDIKVKTENCLFELSKTKFNFLNQAICNNQNTIEDGYCTLNTKIHGLLTPEITKYRYYTSFSSACPLSSDLILEGYFQSSNGDIVANFETQLTFFIKSDLVKCTFTIHNPKPAIHTSGLWDLGDPNSLIFSGLELGVVVNTLTEINWKTDKNQPWDSLDNKYLTIYQESSGGQNWDSTNHKDKNNRVPYTLNGFECRTQNSTLRSGKRASPSLRLQTGTGQVSVFIERFWQNCPKSLGITDNKINIGLFPKEFTGEFELQPGERKTHTFYLDFSCKDNVLASLEQPVEFSLNPVWVEKSGVFPYFNSNVSDDLIHKIINEGLSGNNSFFAKREAIDEYGWRNFGDLYADHETDGYDGDEAFISHYNNQYDPLYGFLRQFALTGNAKWFELADDLANHVVDIDIYHTWHDKNEYNGGLFWHTDHYLDAATSSHRSFSKYQKSNAYIDHAGGGGPGGQHCYTTGLLYHFLITGNDSSRKAVLQLADWVTRVFEGSGTLFGTLLSIKNRNQVGIKNILTGKYPLDRGTGNYVNALLDKFILTQEQTTLTQIEHIIKNTVHPLDDIDTRDLGNAELSWHYTVFFQSLCRYLLTKQEMSAYDDQFYYARDSLLHYAEWMLENEYPYLEKPEILEFPNHTWTAQDIRKVNILLFAYYYSPDNLSAYSDKARELCNYIAENLSSDKTRTYTRILAILMQNHGAVAFFDNLDKKIKFMPVNSYPPLKKHYQFIVAANFFTAIAKATKNFSLKRELLWLSHRSDTIAKLIRTGA